MSDGSIPFFTPELKVTSVDASTTTEIGGFWIKVYEEPLIYLQWAHIHILGVTVAYRLDQLLTAISGGPAPSVRHSSMHQVTDQSRISQVNKTHRVL